MRKYLILIIILFLFIVAGFFIFNKKEESDLKKVKVAEVAHSIFYAPQYVAHKLGYFEEEGLDVEIILTSGADKVTSAVLSGDVNIGFCGSEATIYVYNEGEKDYLINFAALEWALKQNGIDPKSDVKIDTSIAFAAMSGAFIGGEGDFVSLFEPNALEIEKNGYGYVVASIGELGGVVPYTAYNARKSYILENPDVIEGFTRAIQKGLDYVHNNDSREIAKLLEDYFPNTSIDDLEKLVQRHKDIDSWFNSTSISEKDFNHIQEIMISAGELKSKVDYKILVK